MTAPLKRDHQIELMTGAKARQEERIRRWMSDPVAREFFTRPAVRQGDDGSGYHVETVQRKFASR